MFDVNGTLSDLGGLSRRLEQVGGPGDLIDAMFTATLRDGFALTASGTLAQFADIAVPTLAEMLRDTDGLDVTAQAAAEHVVAGMSELDLHPDIGPGMRQLAEAGVRILTLSNGAASVAESLLERAGLTDLVERCLSVSDAGHWKPDPRAYAYAVQQGRCAGAGHHARRRSSLGHRRRPTRRSADRLDLPRRKGLPTVLPRAGRDRANPSGPSRELDDAYSAAPALGPRGSLDSLNRFPVGGVQRSMADTLRYAVESTGALGPIVFVVAEEPPRGRASVVADRDSRCIFATMTHTGRRTASSRAIALGPSVTLKVAMRKGRSRQEDFFSVTLKEVSIASIQSQSGQLETLALSFASSAVASG